MGDLEGQINGIMGRLLPVASSAIRLSAPSCRTHQDVQRALRALLVLLDGGEHGQHETGEDQQEPGDRAEGGQPGRVPSGIERDRAQQGTPDPQAPWQ